MQRRLVLVRGRARRDAPARRGARHPRGRRPSLRRRRGSSRDRSRHPLRERHERPRRPTEQPSRGAPSRPRLSRRRQPVPRLEVEPARNRRRARGAPPRSIPSKGLSSGWRSAAAREAIGRGSRPRRLGDRVDDRLVAGAAAEVAGEEVGDLARGSACRLASSRSVAAIRMPGVQKPHWSAWCSRKAACSGVSSPSPRPSTVRESPPSAWTASIRQERTARRRADRAGAADAVLAADMGAGEPEPWRRKSESSRRGSTASRRAAVDGDGGVDHAPAPARARRTLESMPEYAGAGGVQRPGGSTSAPRLAGARAQPRVAGAPTSSSVEERRPVATPPTPTRADRRPRPSAHAPSRARNRRARCANSSKREPRRRPRPATSSRRAARLARGRSCKWREKSSRPASRGAALRRRDTAPPSATSASGSSARGVGVGERATDGAAVPRHVVPDSGSARRTRRRRTSERARLAHGRADASAPSSSRCRRARRCG